MSKTTWHVDDAAIAATGAYGCTVRAASGMRIADTYDGAVGGEDRDGTAHARLIAAAPDMLAMLKRINERYLLPVGTGPGPEIAALIAKAEGQ